LSKSFRISIGVNVLLLALCGIFLSTLGWKLSRYCLTAESVDDIEFGQVREEYETWPGFGFPVDFEGVRQLSIRRLSDVSAILQRMPPVTTFHHLTDPIRALFDPDLAWDRWFYSFFGGLWNIGVWSFFGLAITRIAVVRLGRDESVLLGESTSFAARRWISCFSAPVLPLVGMFLFTLPMMVLGLIMRADLGVLLAGLIWILAIVVGLCLAVLGLGLLFGWPLMWGTIATEGTDAFDAISRSFSYTFQRPLQYLCYSLVAIFFGVLGWLVVAAFTEAIVMLSGWAISCGTGSARWEELCAAMRGNQPVSGSLQAGLWLINFFYSLVRALVPAFAFSFFFVVAGGIYLLLRQDADQAEASDVFFDEEEQPTFGLPPMDEDSAGVPKVRPEA
jgi:hypothetical protein